MDPVCVAAAISISVIKVSLVVFTMSIIWLSVNVETVKNRWHPTLWLCLRGAVQELQMHILLSITCIVELNTIQILISPSRSEHTLSLRVIAEDSVLLSHFVHGLLFFFWCFVVNVAFEINPVIGLFTLNVLIS